jgi:hypothetical protein
MRKEIRNIAIFAVVAIMMVAIGELLLSGAATLAAIAVFARVCAKNVAGNSAVYLVEASSISAVTVTSGEITAALTMGAGLTFKKVGADIDSIVRTEEEEGMGSNIKITHRIEMKFSKASKLLNALRTALHDASPCGIAAIVTDGNGTSWLVGWNQSDTNTRGLKYRSGTLGSGSEPAQEDGNVLAMTLEGTSGYVAIPFDATIGATITGGTAAFITYA